MKCLVVFGIDDKADDSLFSCLFRLWVIYFVLMESDLLNSFCLLKVLVKHDGEAKLPSFSNFALREIEFEAEIREHHQPSIDDPIESNPIEDREEYLSEIEHGPFVPVEHLLVHGEEHKY